MGWQVPGAGSKPETMSVKKLKLVSFYSLFCGMHAWAMVFIFVFGVTVVFVGVKLYRTKRFGRDDPKVQNRYRRHLKETCHLALYPIVFSAIYGLGCVNRIIYAFHEKTILWLWIPHGIAAALVSLMIPVFFLLHRCFVWYDGRRHNDPDRQPLLNEQVA